ncbi:MAG TPA: hypothetical protein VJI67_03595 [archaeon]|nr:hypothetical protein [archaeon]HLD80640.1 hypothetical protein [archaeon]
MTSKFNFYLGAAIAAWLLAAMIVIAELFAPFKDALKAAFTHHWLGKLVIVGIAFFVFAYLMREKKAIAGITDEKAAWYSVLGSLLVILAFFVVEFIA